MRREGLRRAGVWALLAVELALGAGGFALAPEGAFPEVTEQPLGALALRLAACAHVALVVLSAGVLRSFRGPRAPRLVALGQLTYQLGAGAEGLRLATGTATVMVLPTLWAPAITHGVLGAAALLLLALPAETEGQG